MYSQDSFFDLTLWGQLGLACLSIALFSLMVFISWATLRRRSIWTRIIGALILFGVFVWASPQVYYMYYRMIFPDLPMQWVIWHLREPFKALQMLVFQYRPNLSAHSQGILGWVIFVAPFLGARPK
ncbi:MAG: hypothetical protein ABJM43_09340 [Paracoccaceae bacterium]